MNFGLLPWFVVADGMPMRRGLETIVEIRFKSPEDGGTEDLPEEYVSAPVRLIGSDRTWSMMMELRDKPEYGQNVRASAEFLSEDAPSHRLLEDAQFQILEMGQPVAEATVKVDKISGESSDEEEGDIGTNGMAGNGRRPDEDGG
jgi:hypothetical protein